MRQPHVAQLSVALFLVWPVLLILAKFSYPEVKWRWLWLSVPPTSWCIINGRFLFDGYVGDGAARIFGLLFGWAFMLPFFGVLCLCYLALRRIRHRFNR